MPLPSLHPITDQDLAPFCHFLRANLNDRIPLDDWVAAFRRPWLDDKPNNGFLIRADDGDIVGGIGALYSGQPIDGRIERLCNITSWCVLEDYRAQSMRLAMAVVSQPGYHFTDLTPTDVVAGSLKFLKFKAMDPTVLLLPHRPWTGAQGMTATDAPSALEQQLSGAALRSWQAHRDLPWLSHAMVGRDSDWCHVIYKTVLVKRMRCAKILGLSDPGLWLHGHGAFGRHLLMRRAMVGSWVEQRLLPRRPDGALTLEGYKSKMFRSDSLSEAQISNLYSELTALDL
jgi:hypothetical protein